MRLPNPPKVLLRGLTEEQQRKVILLALEVVPMLDNETIEDDWAAFERVEFANLDVEEKLAFASLLNSKQGATMGSLAQAAYDQKERRE